MKDLPHHMMKLNRRIIRSAHREEMEEQSWEPPENSPYARKQTPQELKKQAKRGMAKERKARAPSPLTPEQKNRKMKNRVPIFNRTSKAKPKTGAKPGKRAKKIPRI